MFRDLNRRLLPEAPIAFVRGGGGIGAALGEGSRLRRGHIWPLDSATVAAALRGRRHLGAEGPSARRGRIWTLDITKELGQHSKATL